MNKIKIIQLLNCVGGVNIWLRLTLNIIDSEKFENIIIHGEIDTKLKFYDNKKNELKEYKIPLVRQISVLNELKAIYKCYKIIKKEKPNIIHVHSSKAGVIGRIVGRFTKTKVLYTPHAFSYLSEKNKIKRSIYLWIERILSNGNSVLVATSNSEKQRALIDVGYHQNNSLVFKNSISIIKSIDKLSIPKTWPDNYICTVGRPSYQKHIDLMIKIIFEIKKVQEIHLVLMGVGHHADELENIISLIKVLDLTKNITLLNWTKREDVLNIIKNSKLYISTARYEGLPYSVIEALALSKPCVVSNCDGNRDLIVDNYNGYIIKNENVKIYKEKIIELLNDKEKHRLYSENSHQSFINNYNIEKNIKELESIYISKC